MVFLGELVKCHHLTHLVKVIMSLMRVQELLDLQLNSNIIIQIIIQIVLKLFKTHLIQKNNRIIKILLISKFQKIMNPMMN